MDCQYARELLSARLDGEDEDGRAAEVDAHLSRCSDCRGWIDQAAAVTRMARIAPARPGPDLAEAILEQAQLPRRSCALAPRWALGALGVGQGCLSLVVLISGRDAGGTGEVFGAGIGHVSYENAAWGMALAVAFLWAAVRMRHLAGLVPVLVTFTVLTLATSAADLATGHVDPVREVPHLLTLLALVLVLWLIHTHPPEPLPRSSTTSAPPMTSLAAAIRRQRPALLRPRRAKPPIAGRRAA